ncbi:MAG: hypothetical protein ABR577_14155 [Pyrinomonadaceae bacterium]
MRNFEAVGAAESFLVAAVASILAIRLFLNITGYPQLGGNGLHIAHMLWGGLLMLAAIITLLSFLGKTAVTAGAILGGVGFGAFIDEVGKFITSDNNYFFKPAVALIYVIFVLLFLVLRILHARGNFTDREYLINALRAMEEAALYDLDEEEQRLALKYLEQSDGALPLVAALKQTLARTALSPSPSPSLFTRIKNLIADFYRYVAQLPFFSFVVIFFFIAQLFVKAVYVFVLIFFIGLRREQILDYRVIGFVFGQIRHLSFVDWAEIASSFLSGIFVLCGVWLVRRARLNAYRMFERSILVSIFLTQVFAFYKEQFSALLGLFFNIAVLVALRYMIDRERTAETGTASI